MGQWNRRDFLASSSLGAVVASRWSRGQSGKNSPILLGGPVFVKSDDPADLAEAHRELGYGAAYAPSVDLNDRKRIQAVQREYAARNILIAEVGAWVNLLDPDLEKRKKNREFVIDRLALAEELGALCCVDIAGSYNPDIWYGPHPENFSRRFFEETVENVRLIIDAVKPKRTTFAIEMMGWAMPTTPDEYVELLRAVDRPEFKVHIDICNLINSPYKIYRNREVIRETFEKLASQAVSCHAKDVNWVPELQVRFKEVIPGRGIVDYREYLSQLARLPKPIPLMLEHLATAEEYKEGADHIRRIGGELGIAFV